MADDDKEVLQLINKVQTKRADIERASRPNYKTNLVFSYSNNIKSDNINLHTVNDLSTFIYAAGYLISRKEEYEKTAKLLGVSKPPVLSWCGYSIDDWIDDIKAKVKKIEIEKEKEKLSTLEKRLDNIISPELRRKLELQSISMEID